MELMKKLGAIMLVLSMLAVCTAAWATSETSDMMDSAPTGVIGDFEDPDTIVSGVTESVILQKEITAYNKDDKDVYAPTISYTYRIEPATVAADASITDSNAASVHASETAVTVKVKPGVGSPTIANNGVVAWTNDDILDTGDNGAPNYKDIVIDFSSINFGAAGVYRYAITEGLTDGYAYDTSGVTETSDKTNGHTRYLDVYVKPSDDYTGNGGAADWDVYGYVCTYANNEEITPDNDTVKTMGFTAGTDQEGKTVTADSYYTYNLEISKTVVNDAYAKSTHSFPFTVIFGESDITKNIKLAAETGTGVTDYNTFITAGAPEWSGVLKIKDVDDKSTGTELDGETAYTVDNNTIRFVGIPAGVDVEIYETNDVSGVTYLAVTVVDGANEPVTSENVTDGSTPTSAQAQAATKNSYESTKVDVDTTADEDDNTAHSVAITNTLQLISPTGYVARYAPYALILIGGIVLLLIARKHKKHTEEE